jgi:multiple sugar transport system permease protein
VSSVVVPDGASPSVIGDAVGLGRRRRRAARGGRRTASALIGRRDRLFLVLAILPAVAWLAVAQGYPLGYSLWLAFQNWSLAFSPISQGFAGFANFTQAVGDPVFHHSVFMTLLVMLSVPVEMAIGFGLAYYALGESRVLRLTRTTLLLPMVIAPIAVGALWRLLLTPNSGLVDTVLHGVGLSQINWLGEPKLSIAAVLAIDIWEWVPFSIIIYTAALTHVDQDLIGAAAVDGASRPQTLRHVIWPLVAPSTILIAIFRLVDALFVIDVVYSLTQGGPGFSTNTVTLWIYNNGLRYFNLSEAAAASWLLLVAALLIALPLLWLRNRMQRATQGH